MDLKPMKFARKPFYVDAVQVTEDNMDEVAKWCMGDVRVDNLTQDSTGERYVKVRVHMPRDERQTMAFVGHWVLYAGTGFKVYTPRAFEKSFEKVVTLTKPQADEAGIHPPIEKKPTPHSLNKPKPVSFSDEEEDPAEELLREIFEKPDSDKL